MRALYKDFVILPGLLECPLSIDDREFVDCTWDDRAENEMCDDYLH